MKSALVQVLHEHPPAAVWVLVASVSMFVASLVLVPWLVVRAPADYFVCDHEHGGPLWTIVLRNLAGALLLVLGILMLALPGQGTLTQKVSAKTTTGCARSPSAARTKARASVLGSAAPDAAGGTTSAFVGSFGHQGVWHLTVKGR